MRAYRDATADPHGYLLIDLSPSTPERERIKARVFPGEDHLVYIPGSVNI
jgi:hypothetical protein